MSNKTVTDLSAFRQQKALLQRVSQEETLNLGVLPTIEHLLKSIPSLKESLPPQFRNRLALIEIELERLRDNVKDINILINPYLPLPK